MLFKGNNSIVHAFKVEETDGMLRIDVFLFKEDITEMICY